jgi:hypothetical protein
LEAHVLRVLEVSHAHRNQQQLHALRFGQPPPHTPHNKLQRVTPIVSFRFLSKPRRRRLPGTYDEIALSQANTLHTPLQRARFAIFCPREPGGPLHLPMKQAKSAKLVD